MTALNNPIIAERQQKSPRLLLSETVIQIAKFMTVGVLNTAIDATAYFVITRWLGLGSALVLAKGIAYVIGMVNSFFWNRTWTFGDNGNIWRAAGLFTLTHIAALAINAGTMALVLNWLQLPEIVALGAATGASFVWNFVLNKLVVFR
ncbi:MAG: GtrA family protein [Anaerolineae bacterium]|jgi:putative flippase GtrA|nr:GtrA family protein [Anaerolineae bacterium]MBT7071606.1 GtrA family protein [Anaerolineae bacterium]MBT7326556.1 GtrA family protein [Anaerolineae bacterium]